MLEKFSLEAQKLIALGESLAFDLSSSSIGKEHLFLAFLKNSESILALELKKYHISYLDFLSLINKTEQDDDVFCRDVWHRCEETSSKDDDDCS